MECEHCEVFIGKDICCEGTNKSGVYKSGNRFQLFYEDDIRGDIEKPLKFKHCPECGRELEE